MRIVVTGAGGLIGYHFSEYLQIHRRENIVIPTGRKPHKYFGCLENFVKADLLDYNMCKAVTEGANLVFHFAATAGGIEKIKTNQSSIIRNNLTIDMNMLEACASNGVGKFFFASSACVYPNRVTNNYEVPPIKEEDAYPADPDNAYGLGKLTTERACYEYGRDTKMKTRVARFFSIFGEGMEFEGSGTKSIMALMGKVAKAKDGDEVEMWGSGNRTRCFCHVDNIMEPIWKLIMSDYPYPINIGSDEPISIWELLSKMIVDLSKKDILIKPIETGVEKGVKGRNCDATKAYDILGWKPHISLDEGIKRTYYWVKSIIGEKNG